MIIHTFNTYIVLVFTYSYFSYTVVYNEVVYLPMELYYLCIDFVFQFIVEKYRNKLNQIKSNLFTHSHYLNPKKTGLFW